MKQYVKPDLFYEDFELSQHIAACDYKINSGDANSCIVEKDRYDDDKDFGDYSGTGFAVTSVCTIVIDSYCYTTGGNGFPRIFQS